MWKAKQQEKIAHNRGFAQRLDAPSHGTKSAYKIAKSHNSKIFPPTHPTYQEQSDGQDRRRRDQNGERQRSQVC
jgi:hypothetical protein